MTRSGHAQTARSRFGVADTRPMQVGWEKRPLAEKGLGTGWGSEILGGRPAQGQLLDDGWAALKSCTPGKAFLLKLGAVSLTANCSEEKQSSWLM